jgi:HIV Tat-specific factor 1
MCRHAHKMEEFKRQLELEYSPGTSPAAGGEQTQTYTDPSDGTVYEWDNEKRAWFPKVLRQHQAFHVMI